MAINSNYSRTILETGCRDCVKTDFFQIDRIYGSQILFQIHRFEELNYSAPLCSLSRLWFLYIIFISKCNQLSPAHMICKHTLQRMASWLWSHACWIYLRCFRSSYILDTIISRSSLFVNSAAVQTVVQKWWEQVSSPSAMRGFPPEQPVACAMSFPIFLTREQNVLLPQALITATPLLWWEEFLPWQVVSIVAHAAISPPFPQWTFFLSLPLGIVLTLENGFPAPSLQIRALAHKLTCHNSVAGIEIWEWSCLV